MLNQESHRLESPLQSDHISATSQQLEYNITVLKELLINSFDAANFEIFCFENFRPVYDEFTPNMRHTLKVKLLIGYCDKHHLYDRLIAAVSEENPRQYERYKSKLKISTIELPQFDDSPNAQAQLLLEFDLSSFTEILRYTVFIFIADILKVRRRQIRILDIRPGSISLILEMPVNTAERLVTLHNEHNPDLQDLRVTKVKILNTRFDPYSLSLSLLSTLTALKSLTYPPPDEQLAKKEAHIKQIQQLARVIYESADLLTEFKSFLKRGNVLQKEFQLGAAEILISEDDLAKIEDLHNRTFRVSRVYPKIFSDFAAYFSPDENVQFARLLNEVKDLLKEAAHAQDYQHFISSLKNVVGHIFEFAYKAGKVYEKDEARFAKIFKSARIFEDWEDSEQSSSFIWKIPVPKIPVPIVSNIAAGLGIITEDKIKDYLLLDDGHRNGADFGVEVVGDSMQGDGILPGDIVLIRQQPTVRNGEIAAIVITTPEIEGLGVLKRYYIVHGNRKDQAHWLFESSNPSSAHLVVIPSGADAEAVRDLYSKRIAVGKILNPIQFYKDAEITIAGKYVGLVRKNIVKGQPEVMGDQAKQ